jgi:hypothetical protein
MSDKFHYQRTTISSDIALWEMFGTASDAEWLGLLEDAERWLLEQESRGKKWGIVIDPSGMPAISADLRRAAGEWRALNMPLIANTCACASYVATNSMLRGAITAVFWFAKPVVPVSVHASQEDAHQWVIAKLNDLSVAAREAI